MNNEPCTHSEFHVVAPITRDVTIDDTRELHATLCLLCKTCKMQFLPVKLNEYGQVVLKPFYRGE